MVWFPMGVQYGFGRRSVHPFLFVCVLKIIPLYKFVVDILIIYVTIILYNNI